MKKILTRMGRVPAAEKKAKARPELPPMNWAPWTMAWQSTAPSETMAATNKRFSFLLDCRPALAMPPETQRVWLLSGGRGAGKTRAGAEWVRWAVLKEGYRRVALVGPALADVREVMIEGPNGLIAGAIHPADRPVWQPSRRRLEWPNGAVAYAFSAEDPDSLRGPQFDLAWCDEAAAWARGEAVWDMLQLALRLGPRPLVMVTTTPRPVALIRRLMADPEVVRTRMPTSENISNLAPEFAAQMQAAYGGTALGRQELEGHLIDDPEGAIFLRAQIDQARVAAAPERLDDCIVAVDPNVSSGAGADGCGIILAGVKAGQAYVLADASVRGLSPLGWGQRAAQLAQTAGASAILAEANQGGEMVREVLQLAGADVAVRLVRARLGKRGRAGPVAALYAQGRVSHAGRFDALEDEMCRFGTEGSGGSPDRRGDQPDDRMDALVWAIWALLGEGRSPRVRVM